MAARDDMDTDDVELKNDIFATPLAYNRYTSAASIANKVLVEVVKNCKPGAIISEIAAAGNKSITDQTSKLFPKIQDKGIAFPTCISVNHTVGHFSPLPIDTLALAEGDLAKVDLGVHVDGYIAQVAHTFLVTANADPAFAITGRQADVICAAHYAGEAAHRLIKPGKKNTDVTEAIAKIAAVFNVNPVEGVLSHQLKQFVIDGNNVIMNKTNLEQKTEEFTFEEGQLFAVDIVMSSGEGKPKELTTKTTVFKRALDQNYKLKLAASKYLLNEVAKSFNTFPFTLAAIAEQSKAKMGITELVGHNLVIPYPVLYEKAGDYVAQIKFVVSVMKNGTNRLTGHPLPLVTSQYKIEDPELLALLAENTKRDKKTEAPAAAAAMDTN